MFEQNETSAEYVRDILILLSVRGLESTEQLTRIIEMDLDQDESVTVWNTLRRLPTFDPSLRIFMAWVRPVSGNGKKGCVLSEIWRILNEKYHGDFDVNTLLTELKNFKNIRNILWNTYFSVPPSRNNKIIAEQVDMLDMDDAERFHLLCFFIQEDRYVKMLMDAVKEMDYSCQEILNHKKDDPEDK